jgi:thiol-disulfide isomerase/thioredoxin
LHSFPKSYFKPELEEQFSASNKLKSGQPALNFTAYGPDGKTTKLSDLAGKVVYIDLWATWCGPCLAEFPHSKKLIRHYRDNPEVAFVFVSGDADEGKWKAFLKKNSDLKGIHLRQRNPDERITEYYRVTGIPHYILIDQLSRIKIANAPRPSDPQIISEIDHLLKSGD